MSIAVLDKAFTVVEVLARTGRALSLAELAEESRLPKPTLCRILRSLRDLGYVQQLDRGGEYRLSDRLSSLREYARDEAVRDKALPLMNTLHEQFDETVNLGILEGLYIRYAHVLETSQALRWIVKPGARNVFHTTALGRAIVAHLPGEQQARLVARRCPPAAGRGRAPSSCGNSRRRASAAMRSKRGRRSRASLVRRCRWRPGASRWRR